MSSTIIANDIPTEFERIKTNPDKSLENYILSANNVDYTIKSVSKKHNKTDSPTRIDIPQVIYTIETTDGRILTMYLNNNNNNKTEPNVKLTNAQNVRGFWGFNNKVLPYSPMSHRGGKRNRSKKSKKSKKSTKRNRK